MLRSVLFRPPKNCFYTFKFEMLQVRENAISLHEWCGGAAHSRSLEGTLVSTHRPAQQCYRTTTLSEIDANNIKAI